MQIQGLYANQFTLAANCYHGRSCCLFEYILPFTLLFICLHFGGRLYLLTLSPDRQRENASQVDLTHCLLHQGSCRLSSRPCDSSGLPPSPTHTVALSSESCRPTGGVSPLRPEHSAARCKCGGSHTAEPTSLCCSGDSSRLHLHLRYVHSFKLYIKETIWLLFVSHLMLYACCDRFYPLKQKE